MNKKIWVTVLALCFVLCLGIQPCLASASEVVPYASDVIDYTSLTFTSSNGKVYADAHIATTDRATKIGFKSVTIYHKVNGVWSVAASVSGKYSSGTDEYTCSVSCNLVSGREYKASCSSYAVVDGKSDTGSASVSPTTF